MTANWKFLFLLIFFQCTGVSKKSQESDNNNSPSTIGSIERLDPRMDQIIPKEATIEILAEGFLWSEGPVWVDELNSLLFSDVPDNKIYQWNEETGNSIYLQPAGYTGIEPNSDKEGSNGLILDQDGNLLICQHGDRRIASLSSLKNPEPTFSTVINRFDGKRFNSPNDLVLSSSGDLYFTDPPYGLNKQDADSLKELPYNGVYKLNSDGEVQLLIDSLTRPNGIALSPDEKILYVANSDPEKAIWAAYEIIDSGLENGRVLFDATDKVKERKGLPDGLKVNKEGILFATGPGGVLVLTPDGEHLGTILTESATANCAFGPNEDILYMTTHQYLTRIRF